MNYYHFLGLEKEPFSTSPDPDFFYESTEHHAALVKAMIEIRLRRGVSVLLGDVGTGKTTLARKLSQMLMKKERIAFHMILDPTCQTEDIFLESLIKTFKIEIREINPSILVLKEAIKDFLFKKGVEENKTIVLLIDEAQKLNLLSLEVLRVLLNYETNEYKLLQLLLVGQMELLPKIRKIRNFWDRLSMKYVLNSLSEEDTKGLIEFRIRKAGCYSGRWIFTDESIKEIYNYTHGYPRRILQICHNAFRALMVDDKAVIDGNMIRGLIAQETAFA